MPNKTELKILVIRESLKESLISDGTTFCMLLATILISSLLNSQGIGWAGAIMLFIFMFSRSFTKPKRFFTIPEARAELDRMEAEMKKE
jgi:hypothetical protein